MESSRMRIEANLKLEYEVNERSYLFHIPRQSARIAYLAVKGTMLATTLPRRD